MTFLPLKTYRWPLFILLFFCFTTVILGDSTAEALFLSHFDSHLIGSMFLVNALFLFVLSAFLISLIDRFDRGTFFTIFLIVHGCMLLCIRAAVMAKLSFLYLPLFSYAYVTKIFLLLLFWTLANDLVDSRRAGFEFPLIAAGGTLGAILISFSLPFVLKLIAAENLLLCWAGLTLLLAALFQPVRRSFAKSFKPAADHQRKHKRTVKSFAKDLHLITGEPLLLNMAILYCALFFILVSQQYAFYFQLKHRFTQADQLASFLGYFNGISMLCTFVLQLLLAGRVTKKIGSTRAMFFLPAVLSLAFLVLTILGMQMGALIAGSAVLFWGVVASMGARIGAFDSFFSPNFQVFFSGLPQEIRGRGKVALEGIVKPVAIALAGLWILFVIPRIPFWLTMAILFCLALFMIYQTLRIKKTYAQSLTRYLMGFKARKGTLLQSLSAIADSENSGMVMKDILEREQNEVKQYIIELLAKNGSREAIATLCEHFTRCDPHNRATIISALTPLKRTELKPFFIAALDDSDYRVTANAVLAIGVFGDEALCRKTESFLHHEHNRVKANAIIALWPNALPQKRPALLMILKAMAVADSIDDRASALYAMGTIGDDAMLDELTIFYQVYNDAIFDSRLIWQRFLSALSGFASPRAFALLMSLTARADSKKRTTISQTITAQLQSGLPIDLVVDQLTTGHFMQRSVLLRALLEWPEIPIPRVAEALQTVAQEEIKAAYLDWSAIGTLRREQADDRINLLITAIIEESVQEHVNNALHVSALLDCSGQTRAILFRIRHTNRHISSRACEVLDNVGDRHLNQAVIALLDTDPSARHSQEARTVYKIEPQSLNAVMHFYQESPNGWVRICAAGALQHLPQHNSSDWQQLQQHGDEILGGLRARYRRHLTP